MASDILLPFDMSPFQSLDEFALLACQKYNLGNETDWFTTFRGGLFGFHARIHGVAEHFHAVHAWLPKPRSPKELECHLASIFFNMDSATECLTFALNAVGYAAEPGLFRDVTNSQELRMISPIDIIGIRDITSPRPLQKGYSRIFPTFQEYWIANRDLLFIIFDQHDVSKHRSTIFKSGKVRRDPPFSFYEKLGIEDMPRLQVLFSPMAEIKLRRSPKEPVIRRTPHSESVENRIILESAANQFCEFINESGVRALNDAKTNIQLPHQEFLNRLE